jgi:hypothetical protein
MRDDGDDDLSFQQLHELLNSVTRQAHGGDRLAAEMLGIIREMADRGLGVPASARIAPPAVVIMMRVQARRLAAAIGDALTMALIIRNSELSHDPERALAPASRMATALSRAAGLLRDLGPDCGLQVDLDHDIGLARDLTTVLARSVSFDSGRARRLVAALVASVTEIRHRTSDLAFALGSIPVDASGADLSGIEIASLAPLHGVTWTRQTIWPPALANRIQPYSQEAQPGVYLIRILHGAGGIAT